MASMRLGCPLMSPEDKAGVGSFYGSSMARPALLKEDKHTSSAANASGGILQERASRMPGVLLLLLSQSQLSEQS